MTEEDNRVPEPGNVAEGEEVEETDVEMLKHALQEEKNRAGEYLANWQRAQADYINYKRRCEREKDEIGEFARSSLILNILPVLDDFRRAVSAVTGEAEDTAWMKGIMLIERKLQSVLEMEGLSPIEVLGKVFDPVMHEAVRQSKGEDGIIVEEVRTGYRFRDRVIRPSQVVVGNGETEEE